MVCEEIRRVIAWREKLTNHSELLNYRAMRLNAKGCDMEWDSETPVRSEVEAGVDYNRH